MFIIIIKSAQVPYDFWESGGRCLTSCSLNLDARLTSTPDGIEHPFLRSGRFTS